MAAPAWWVPFIRARAKSLGLDPKAVLAVARMEGLSGGVGDGGHAFGPFQMNDAGGVLTGRAGNHRAYAESRAGINEALQSMARVAGGLTGKAAIINIVKRYERPLDPSKEIAGALGHYGLAGLGGGGSPANSDFSGGAGLGAGGGADQFKAQAISTLLAAAANGGQFAPGSLMALAQARKQQGAAESMFGPGPTLSGTGGKGKGGINELFYDPLGGIKHGQQIGAIGHHSDHVHVALGTLQAQLNAERQARAMGLRVGEEQDSDVHPVHTDGSYHYRKFAGSKYRQAADVSGNAKAMAAYYRWIARTYG